MSDHECVRCPECDSCPACAADALDREVVENERLLAALETATRERDKAWARLQATVASVAENRLDGYRALGQRALDAEVAAEAERLAHIGTKGQLAAAFARLAEDNVVCLCGCPASEHEGVDEGAEQCEHEDHECLRVAPAVLEIVGRLRERLAAAERERDEARRTVEALTPAANYCLEYKPLLLKAEYERDRAVRVLREIAAYGWYAKGAKVARAYFSAKEGR